MALTIKTVWNQLWAEGQQQGIFPTKTNPNLEDIREPVLNWVKSNNIGDDEAIATYKTLDYDGHTAYIYPAASHSQLLLVTKWITWFFLFDNHIDDQPVDKMSPGTFALLNSLNQIVSTNSSSSPDVEALTCPFTKPLIDLWSEARDLFQNRAWERRFARRFYDFQQALLWEICNRKYNRIWDFQTYVDMKRCCTGSQVGGSFVELFVSSPVPDTFLDSFLSEKLLNTAGDILHLATDIRSYERENSLGPSTMANAISTLQQTLNYSLEEAFDLFIAQWQAKARYFKQFLKDLDLLMESLGMGTHQQKIIHEYIEQLSLWMGGNMRWLVSTSRYVIAEKTT
ncbi:terpene synthase family protein [Olivibacter jilunii]|uniref:terpene synthase family protein n=1 Tax=Olivibacter jilunii TaxID=985016 RepID=UPI003F14D9BA